MGRNVFLWHGGMNSIIIPPAKWEIYCFHSMSEGNIIKDVQKLFAIVVLLNFEFVIKIMSYNLKSRSLFLFKQQPTPI